MNTITVKPNQSMPDVIIQALGSMEAGIAFCALNDVAISDVPTVGAAYKVPVSTSVTAPADNTILQYLAQNAIVLGTLGNHPPAPPPLGLTILLKPVMAASYIGTADPSTLGYYPIAIDGTVDFVNANALLPAYLDLGKIWHEDETSMVLAASPTSVNEIGGMPMTSKHVEYQIPWPMALGDIWVWGKGADAFNTVTFEDVIGNIAFCSPVIVLYDHTAGIEEYLIADLQVDFVSTDGYTATLRLTRSHQPTAHINIIPPYGHVEMTWISNTAGLYQDPAHVGNPDIRLIDLTPGKYIFGVDTKYVNDVVNFDWPPHSAFTMVIEIS